MAKQKIAFAISLALIILGISSFFANGIRYGIDFNGGTLIQVKFTAPPPLAEIRSLLNNKLGYLVEIITFGSAEDNEILITLPQEALSTLGQDLQTRLKGLLSSRFDHFSEIRRVESVGPKVGEELRMKALEAGLFTLVGILIYISVRFRFNYAFGAVAALFHDVLITMGVFVLLGKEFNLTTVAALLTIIGYSLNDTIVVFDRIRENVSRLPKTSLLDIVNLSVNETLSRTILTSLTTFFVVAILFFFGGQIIHDFSFAMMIGLLVGTYSSIFVASPIMIFFDRLRS